MNPTWIEKHSACVHCDAGLPHYGPDQHIEPNGFGWRLVSCTNTPDCIFVPEADLPAYQGEKMPQQPESPMLSNAIGRAVGALVLAALVFLAVAYLFQQ